MLLVLTVGTPLRLSHTKPVASEYQIEAEPEHGICPDLFHPTDDGLFLGTFDDLDVRRQLRPRRYGNIVESLEPLLVSQELPNPARSGRAGFATPRPAIPDILRNSARPLPCTSAWVPWPRRADSRTRPRIHGGVCDD